MDAKKRAEKIAESIDLCPSTWNKDIQFIADQIEAAQREGFRAAKKRAAKIAETEFEVGDCYQIAKRIGAMTPGDSK